MNKNTSELGAGGPLTGGPPPPAAACRMAGFLIVAFVSIILYSYAWISTFALYY